MSLSKIYNAMETVEVGGQQFTLRGVTRAEQFKIQKMVQADAPEDELEIAAIACATDSTIDETREWYGQTPTWAVKELLEHIQRTSRLDEGAQKSGG